MTVETTRQLEKKASEGDVEAMFRLAYRLAFNRNKDKRDLQRAIRLWERAGRRKHPRALFYLGTVYDNALGGTASYTVARAYYRAAAHLGHPEAAYNLALMYREGQGGKRDLRTAARFLRIAADAGVAAAMRDLGVAYFEGKGVKEDHRLARKLYEAAARKGDRPAARNLARLLGSAS